MTKKLNKRKCKVCRQIFKKQKPLQCVCSHECAIANANILAEKNNRFKAAEMRKQTKAKLEGMKKLSEVASNTQRFFNQYVRERDKAAGYGCISCGTKNPDIQYCAGHFRTRGAAPHLRFNEENVWLQCNKRCNLELSGNIGAYRQELIKRIGIERVEALESDNTPKKWTREELIAIKVKYKQLTKELKEKNER